MDIISLTDDTFADFLSKNPRAIICFMAEWSGPFRMLRPVLYDLANTYLNQITFAIADVDQCPKATAIHNIRSIPACVFFRQGQILTQRVGYHSLEALRELINIEFNINEQ